MKANLIIHVSRIVNGTPSGGITDLFRHLLHAETGVVTSVDRFGTLVNINIALARTCLNTRSKRNIRSFVPVLPS